MKLIWQIYLSVHGFMSPVWVHILYPRSGPLVVKGSNYRRQGCSFKLFNTLSCVAQCASGTWMDYVLGNTLFVDIFTLSASLIFNLPHNILSLVAFSWNCQSFNRFNGCMDCCLTLVVWCCISIHTHNRIRNIVA